MKKDFQEVVTLKEEGLTWKKKGQDGVPCQENTGKRVKKHGQQGNRK